MAPVLRISLGANLALASVVAALLWHQRPAVPAAPAWSGPSADRPTEVAAAPARPAATGLRDALAQLEEQGLPREVVADALVGDLHRRWDVRVAELERRYAPRRVPDREYVELARQRDAEQERELVAALGADGYLAWDKARTLRLHNAGNAPLSPAEADTVYRLQKDFDTHQKELQMAVEDGVADAADISALHAQAQASLDSELRQLLGTERFNQLRGLSDPLTEATRRFGDLNPTAAQAQAVLQIDGDYCNREAALARQLQEKPGAVDPAAELRALAAAREENLRRIFGAEAYETTRRDNDSTYQRIAQFASAWDLRPAELAPVYETLRAFREEMDLSRSAAAMREAAGQRVNWRSIDASIERVRQQTETDLVQLLGDKRAWRLKENGLLATR